MKWKPRRAAAEFGLAWACDPIGNQYLVSGQLEKKTADLDELSTWARSDLSSGVTTKK